MNVDEYYVDQMGKLYYPQTICELGMPLNSLCGESCKKAIDDGAALKRHAIAGFGDADYGVAMAVCKAVYDICSVYCNG